MANPDRESASRFGRLGGLTTRDRHGYPHYAKAGRRGGEVSKRLRQPGHELRTMISPEIWQALERQANAEGVSVPTVVRRLLTEWATGPAEEVR